MSAADRLDAALDEEPITADPQRVGDAVVLADTTDMLRDEWLGLRRLGIGGSDAAAICGQDRWRSAFEVWLEKTGAPGVEDEDSEAAAWGRRLEPVVAEALAERTGLRLEPVRSLLAHPDRPWQLANIDRLADDGLGFGVAEVKTAGHWSADEWADDRVPDRYMLQGLHYLSVTGFAWCVFGCLVAGQRLVVRRVDRDDELIAHLVSLEADFWQRVQDGTPPPPDGSKACTDLLAHLWDVKPGSVLTVDNVDEVDALLARRAEADAAAKAAKQAKDEAENQLKALLGEAEVAMAPDGAPLFTWKEVPSTFVEGYQRAAYRKFHVPKRKAAAA